MLQKVIHYLHASKAQLFKYIVVGGSGVVLDIGTLKLFTDLFSWNAVVAVAVNQILLLSYNFLLNKYWSFQNKDMPHKQLVRYCILVGCNYFFSVAMMYLWNERLGFDEIIVRVASIGIMTTWNFFLYKNWVYRKSQEPKVKSQEANVE